ncbi:hypothetical protein C4D60_Mb08t18680 [Musa balbisiana]|uniref:Cyclic nucleotide-binding domain-containing protein n=1 Tax=Musa balbisiana TaxID=52838 RepID=A0A4S8K4U3_MUSBA|nr:hypothetical protein C4D60_Mb08t18680 [Musa balbisiana]
MAASAEVPAPYDAGKADGEGPSPDDAVIFVGISLLLGIGSRHLLRGTRVPYTVALLILGIVLGSIEYGTSGGLGKLGAGIRLWANINPNLLLSVFLPALLFESSFSLEVHQIKRCMVQMLLLAGPGVLISTFFLGVAVKITFPYGWDWKTSLLLGGLLSATDPVAVVALLKELGASKKMNTIIEGESLMNDGTAIVVFQLFYQMVLGRSFNVGDIIKFLSQVALGAAAMGIAFGIVSVLWLGFIFNDTVIEITLTLAVSYIAFFTAQDAADVSGVLTVMTLGMFYAAFARTAFKGDGQRSLHHFWEMVAYIANTLIFILSGVVIAEAVLNNDSHFERHGTSWGYVMLLYVYLQVSRIVVVGSLFPLLQYFGYGLTWKEAIILVWSGLRGTVALALALAVKRASDNLDESILKRELGTLFLFFTGGTVFLTLILNGSTVQFFLQLLDMDKLSTEKIRILNYARYEMLNKALESFGDLGDDEELGPADWPTVRRYITCLSNLDEGQIHPHNISEGESYMQMMNLRDVRVRFLNGESAIATAVINESNAEGEEARKFLEDTDLKKLLRNPPMVKMPKISELLSSHPLLGALPSAIREPLGSSTKETMTLHGVNLYREGSKPTGIWLISVGVVKWTSKNLRNKHSLHPTFSHGSTLGLYEVLTGKPYICNMVTDSVVHYFFIKSEKILSLLTSDPAIEDFLWQESAIVIAKILLPQIFEKMSMQELRGLIAERSSMNKYIRGEVVEIRPKSIGFLLEGFIKTQNDQEQLITSPAVLLSSQTDQSFIDLESSGVDSLSFCHTASRYQVETRARVIFFDIGVSEADGALQKRSASWISQSGEPQRTLSKEHIGLLSWPEHLYKATGHHQSPNESIKQSTSLSAKAMELSIYGSMVNVRCSHCRNIMTGSTSNHSHSLSYPRVPSRTTDARSLVSVQSEGSSLKSRLAPRRSGKSGSIAPLPIGDRSGKAC